MNIQKTVARILYETAQRVENSWPDRVEVNQFTESGHDPCKYVTTGRSRQFVVDDTGGRTAVSEYAGADNYLHKFFI